MDPLRRDDIERARRSPPEAKLRQALTLMDDGMRLKRVALRKRFPELDEAAIEERLTRWLRRED